MSVSAAKRAYTVPFRDRASQDLPKDTLICIVNRTKFRNLDVVKVLGDRIKNIFLTLEAKYDAGSPADKQFYLGLLEDHLRKITGSDALAASMPTSPLTAAYGPAASGVSNLPWPTETYSDAHRNRGVNIVQFLEERYAELIDAGQVTRPKLREHDPSADTAVANYLRGGRQLPDHLHIPTRKEAGGRTSEMSQVSLEQVREAERFARTARNHMAARR